MEYEYKALTYASVDLLWISYILRDIVYNTPLHCTLYTDNISATQLAHNPIFHARTKYIELSYHFICELVSIGFLQVLFAHSNNQLADLFTKGLPSSTFRSFCGQLLWHPPRHLEGAL